MKYILILSFFAGFTLLAEGQEGGSRNGKVQAGKTNSNAKKPAARIRGTGQFHGSKDTTPGSPMGTGGAGGSGMSGSPAGSASESALHQGKAAVQPSGRNASSGSETKNTTVKRKRPKNRKI